MTMPSMEDMDFASYEYRFGSDTFARGQQYFDEGRVGYVDWNQQASTVSASVHGHRATPYSTSVSVNVHQGRIVAVDHARCNCPVVFNCKHAVAVLLQAREVWRESVEDWRPPAVEHWATALAPLLDARKINTDHCDPHLGLHLQLGLPTQTGDSIRLLAQPVLANSIGRWSTSGISWNALPYTADPTAQARVDILRELHALHRVRSYGRAAQSFHHSAPDSIDLTDVSGRLLWDLLSDIHDSGLPLIESLDAQETIPWATDARFEVDITGAGTLEVEGRIIVDGSVVPAERRRFLGHDGSGIVYWEGDEPLDPRVRPFGLARLANPVPLQLRGVASASIDVPESDRIRFATSYLPALERGSTIVSSDGSFTPPTVVGPELHITVMPDGVGCLDVTARWRYYVDDTELDFAANSDTSDTAVRDTTAELDLLRTVQWVLGRSLHHRAAFHAFNVAGIEAAQFVAKSLPLLDAYDNVHVDFDGDVPDFRDVTDNIGISLSTRAVRGDNDWFDLGVVLTIDGSNVEFATVIVAIARGDSHLVLSDGRYFSLDRPAFHTLRALVEEARAWREQASSLSTAGSVPVQSPPNAFGAELRPYQLEGYSWLYFLWQHSLGGILADDMGLGKTIQTLALVAKAKETGSLPSPFIVVAPTSVVHNWAREAAQFAPGLMVATVSGTRSRRRTSIAEIAATADIVVTSYTVFRLDFDDFQEVAWSGLVLDEAQYVKNYKSKSYHCARRLSAPFKLAITGTPMENNIMELWALLSITAPGLFPSAAKFTDVYRIRSKKRETQTNSRFSGVVSDLWYCDGRKRLWLLISRRNRNRSWRLN